MHSGIKTIKNESGAESSRVSGAGDVKQKEGVEEEKDINQGSRRQAAAHIH